MAASDRRDRGERDGRQRQRGADRAPVGEQQQEQGEQAEDRDPVAARTGAPPNPAPPTSPWRRRPPRRRGPRRAPGPARAPRRSARRRSPGAFARSRRRRPARGRAGREPEGRRRRRTGTSSIHAARARPRPRPRPGPRRSMRRRGASARRDHPTRAGSPVIRASTDRAPPASGQETPSRLTTKIRVSPGRDDAAGAAVAVPEVRRDDQAAAAADPHAGDARVPAGDHLAGAQAEAELLAAVPRGVELLAAGVGHADVVHRDRLARARPRGRRPRRGR